VLEVMAEDDPEAAIEIARTRDDRGAADIIRMAISILAARSLDKAMPLLEEFTSDNSIAFVASALSAREPDEAFNFCRDENGQLNSWSVEMLANDVPAHRAGEFFRTLEKIAPDLATTHVKAAGRLLQMMARTDPVEAIQWVEKNWPNAQKTELSLKLSVLGLAGESEPALAATALFDWVNRPETNENVRNWFLGSADSTVQSWIARDPESAADWILNQTSFRPQWLASVPADAFERVSRLIDQRASGERRSELQRSLMWSRSSYDPAAVLTFADTISDARARDALRATALTNWFRSNPAAASATAATLSPVERGWVATECSGPLLAPVFAKLIESPIELPGIPAGIPAQFVAGLSAQVSLGNTDGAMAALENLPPEARSVVAAELAWSTARNHPEVAWRLVERVNDPMERMELESRLLRRRWTRADGPTD
jgi:hypothetical protein